MKKFTIYQDDRTGSQRVRVSITKPTDTNRNYGCAECGRLFKKHERVLKISFRHIGPRCICSGCAYEKLTAAIQILGRIYKKGEGYTPYQTPEQLKPSKGITEETNDDIPF